MKRYQPIVAKYGSISQAEMKENEHGQWYSKQEVDELLREALNAIYIDMAPETEEKIKKALGI